MTTITLDKHPNGYDFIADVSPMLNSRIRRIQAFDVFDRTKIYMHYYITQLGLKHNFKVVDTAKDNWKKGRSEPDKTFKQIAFYYLWKDTKIKTLDEFYSEQNIEIRDCGKDWKERGYAQRWWIECLGAYDWFWRFNGEFNLV